MRRFRLAACQYPIERSTSFEAWGSKLKRWVAEAKDEGAQILLFPEYGSCESLDWVASGMGLDATLQSHQLWIPELKDHLQSLAREFGVVIVAGSWLEQTPAGFVNRTWVFAPNERSGHVDKLMLTPEERRNGWVRGQHGAVFETQLGRFGIAICYDSEFPLVVRRLVEQGADVVLVPSCTDSLEGYYRVRIGCQARALENQCYVVQAVTVGTAPWQLLLDHNRGAAGVYGPPDVGFPSDGVVAAGTLDAAQWVYADIDLDRLQLTRERGQVRGREDWARPEHGSASVVLCDLR